MQQYEGPMRVPNKRQKKPKGALKEPCLLSYHLAKKAPARKTRASQPKKYRHFWNISQVMEDMQ